MVYENSLPCEFVMPAIHHIDNHKAPDIIMKIFILSVNHIFENDKLNDGIDYISIPIASIEFENVVGRKPIEFPFAGHNSNYENRNGFDYIVNGDGVFLVFFDIYEFEFLVFVFPTNALERGA